MVRWSVSAVNHSTLTTYAPMPNVVHVSNPMDGPATFIPLFPPDYVAELLVFGGSAVDDSIPAVNLSSQTPASHQCTRMTLTPEGIKKGWVVERILEGRTLCEILMSNGQVSIISGAGSGYAQAAIGGVRDY